MNSAPAYSAPRESGARWSLKVVAAVNLYWRENAKYCVLAGVGYDLSLFISLFLSLTLFHSSSLSLSLFSFLSRFSQTRDRDTRKENRETPPKRRGLEEIRLPLLPPPSLSARASAVLRGSSAFPPAEPVFFLFPQSRDLFSAIFFPRRLSHPFSPLFVGDNDISLVPRPFVTSRVSDQARHQRGREAVGSAMKRTSGLGTLQILKISTLLITRAQRLGPPRPVLYISVSRVPLFAS